MVQGGLEGPLDEVDAEPVADESGSVIAHGDPLAQVQICECAESLYDCLVDLGSCHYLQERQVSRRVEEVSDEEPGGDIAR